MATVADIGVPGQPATNLTAWQAAVRDQVTANTAALAALKLKSGSSARAAQGAGDTSQFVTVTFTPAFSAVPAVAVSIDGDSTCGGVTVAVDNLTASGMTIRRMNPTGATKTYGVRWLAIGPA